MFIFMGRELLTVTRQRHQPFQLFYYFLTSGHDCSCSGDNDENMCNTLGLDQVREGHAKYWCYVDKDSPCVDIQESSSDQGRFYSFQACASE